MASVSTIAKNTSMMYQAAAKGISAQKDSSVNYAELIIGQNNKKSQSNNIWSLTSQNKHESSSDFITALSENRTALTGLMSSYSSTSKMFKAEFSSTMLDLKTDAKRLSSANFDIIGSTEEETQSNLKATVDTLSNFVKSYNNAISLFDDYSDISKRMSNMHSLFADNSARASSLNDIGVKVDAQTGMLSVDEKKFSEALVDSPSRVEHLLGKYGLAGKAETNVNIANSQSSVLFPSVTEMMGSDLAKKQASYSGSALLSMTGYQNIGNFLNMYF